MSSVLEEPAMHFRSPEERTLKDEMPNLVAYLEPEMSVLDVGGGPGIVTLDVAATVQADEACGIDSDEGRIHMFHPGAHRC